MVMLPQNHCQFILMSRARGRKAHFSETKFKPPNASFIFICFQLAVHDLYSVFCFPLTPGAFYPKCFFGHLGDFFLAQACIEIKILKQESRVQNSSRLPATAGTLVTLAGDFSRKQQNITSIDRRNQRHWNISQ